MQRYWYLSLLLAGEIAAEPLLEEMSAAELDWVPNERLAPSQRNPHCGGAYVPVLSDSPEAGQAPKDAPLNTSANSSTMRENNVLELSGDVSLEKGYQQLHADKVTYQRDTQQLTLEGNILIREPNLFIRAGKAQISQEDGSGVIEPADYVMHEQHIRGSAKQIARKSDETFVMSQASYTHCEPGNESWNLRASSIKLDREEGVGTAKHARVELGGVPVFYSPYLQFPIDDRRRSGLLWPSYANTSQGGFDIALPYYLNLAPNYDATVTPRYITDRGMVTELEGRHLSEWGSWVASGSYIADDKETGNDRWLIGVKEKGKLGDRWTSHVDFTRVSDEAFFNDLSTRGLAIQRETHLDQLAQVNYWGQDWRFSAKFHQFQTIESTISENNRPYKLLPQVTLTRNSYAQAFTPHYSFYSQYTYFEHDLRTSGQRVYLEPGVSYPMEWLAGFVKPSLKLRHASYLIDDPEDFAANNDDKTVGYTVPSVVLDSGLFFERDLTVGGSSYQQTLEPRFFYLYTKETDQSDIPLFDTTPLTFGFHQLFRERRFAGYDRIGDANQATLGLTSRFIDDEGNQKLSMSLGQIYYFRDRVVSTTTAIDKTGSSVIAGELEYRPTDQMRLTSSVLWDREQDSLNEAGFQYQYQPQNDMLFNLSYRFRRDNPTFDAGGQLILETIQQVDFSAVFPVGENWRAFLRWQYDLERDDDINDAHTIEDMLGVEYSNCCWDFRLVYQRGLDGTTDLNGKNKREHAIYFQFVLRGLGSLGSKVDQVLDKSILGYSGFRENLYR